MVRIVVLFSTAALCMLAEPSRQEYVPNERAHCMPAGLQHRGDYEVFRDSIHLDTTIRNLMSQWHILGAATLIVKDGRMIWQKPYGYARLEDSVQVNDSTLFTLMSVSKTMVAWAAMQLWERGVFGLDDDINDYLPFRVVHPRYPDSVITFRMLMAHTSGLKDAIRTIIRLISWGRDSPIPMGVFLRDYFVPGGQYYDSLNNFTQEAPGTVCAYSNTGVTLLAYLVQTLADSFPRYCRDSVFGPLGMNRTRWFLSELDTMCVATPYAWNGANYLRYGHYGHPCYPMGFLRTSAPELARSLQAFMQHGRLGGVRLLDSTTVEMMTTIQFPQADSSQGLIWYKWPLFNREVWGHHGSWFGVGTFQFYYPAENSGVIVLTNVEWSEGVHLMAHEMFEYAAQHITVEENRGGMIAGDLLLRQNHPNPFKSATTIDFELKTAAPVRLDVYNVTGQRVARLLDREMSPGPYSVRFDGRGLPSGVYCYSLSSPGLTQTRRCVLVR